MSETIITVDRIEKDIAVLERGNNRCTIPLAMLPDINEGDQLRIIIVDNSETRNEAEARLERLKKRTPSTDDIIDL